MQFPRYWVRAAVPIVDAHGRDGQVMCWGWSDSSPADAEERGRVRARRLAERLLGGDRPPRYLYADRPLREEVLEEMRDGRGAVYAAITRNSYGCRVLNTSNVMFVDVDLPEEKKASSGGGLLGRLFGRSAIPPAPSPESAALDQVRSLVRDNPQLGARLYRTRAGLRYLFTHAAADPASRHTEQFMVGLGADPLYVRLCAAQQSFRARLTPKPWRCGLAAPAVRWPWTSPQAESRYQAWELAYANTGRHFATCRLLEALGEPPRTAEMAAIVALHDRLTQATADLPLA